MHPRIFSAIRRLAAEAGLQQAWEWAANRYCWSAFPPAPEVRNRLLQITGLTRSGKTLLGAILATHPEVLMLHEPYHQWLFRGFVEYVGGDVVSRWSGHPGRLLSALAASPTQWIAFEEPYRSRAHGRWANQCFFERNLRLGIRTLVMMRDPRDIWIEIATRIPEKKGHVPDRFLDSWNSLARWVRSEKIHHVRYEDLVRDPQFHLRQLWLALHLDPTAIAGVHSGDPGLPEAFRWNGGAIDRAVPSCTLKKGSAFQADCEQIAGACGPLMCRFGYR
ncbi:hypothetical protein ABUL39_09335 [Rhodothermus marinus]|uniref:hypothetical protein n=1 Tax=Rhodothermus marinus TaxID=29549 RepID=UPI0037C58088